jgi:hypothetical protein
MTNPAQDHVLSLWELFLQEPGSAPIVSTPPYGYIAQNDLPRSTTRSMFRVDIPFERPGSGDDGFAATVSRDQVSETASASFGLAPVEPETISSHLLPQQENAGGARGTRAAAVGSTGGGGDDGNTNPDDGSSSGGGGVPDVALSLVPLNNSAQRWMHWNNLIPISIREIRRTANSTPAVNATGRPRLGDLALFVIEFVDYRYALQAIYGTYSFSQIAGAGTANGFIKDGEGNRVVGGPINNARLNMIAETPTALESDTTHLTYIYPPTVSPVAYDTFANDVDNAGTIATNAIPIANLAASAAHVQKWYGLQEIFEQFAATVYGMTKGRVSLSKDDWETSVSASSVSLVDDGDIINLDFRAMSVGQALDVLAQRIGAVWAWDRSTSTLMLQVATCDHEKYACRNIANWLLEMEPHRVVGYINTLTLDIPKTVIVSHESVYCSVIGPYLYANDGSAMTLDEQETYAFFVDCRSAATEGGFVSTKYVTGLSPRAPMIWHTQDSQPSYLSVEIKDHIPALIGSYYPENNPIVSLPGERDDFYGRQYSVEGKRIGIGTASAQQSSAAQFYEYTPWNYSNPTFSLLFNINPASGSSGDAGFPNRPEPRDIEGTRVEITLKDRRNIYEQRMARLRGVVDGDMTCNRMPPSYWEGRYRQTTPSVGLQYDYVEFGFESGMTVRYRIFGKNTHPLLYPHGAKMNRMAAGNAMHAFNSAGTQTISVRRRESNNIKRAFLCKFEPHRAISDSGGDPDNPANIPFIYLYKFVEVVPDINAATMFFAQQDALGWTRAEGYALNICEMNYLSKTQSQWTPDISWDGSAMNLRPRTATGTPLDQIYPTPPEGYAICYEIYNRAGFTSYYLFAPPGSEVICAAPSFTFTPPPWEYMGVSGTAKPTESKILDDMMGA